MKRSVPVMMVAGLIALGAATTASAEIKIGVVNTQRLMNDAPQAKAAIDLIRTEFAPKEREMQTLGTALKARDESELYLLLADEIENPNDRKAFVRRGLSTNK